MRYLVRTPLNRLQEFLLYKTAFSRAHPLQTCGYGIPMTAESNQKSRKILIVVLVVIIALCIGGYFALVHSIKTRTLEELALCHPFMDIQAETVEVSLLQRGVTLSNVTMTPSSELMKAFPELGGTPSPETMAILKSLQIKADAIEGRGTDLMTFLGFPGDESTFATSTVRNLTVTLQGMNFMTLEDYTIRNAHWNYRQFIEILRSSQGAAPSLLFARLLPCMKTFYAGEITTGALDANMIVAQVHMEGSREQDYSYLKSGPVLMGNITISFLGQKMASIGSISMDGMELPAMYDKMFSNFESAMDPQKSQGVFEDILAQYDGDMLKMLTPFRYKNLRFNDVAVSFSGYAGTMKELLLDVEVNAPDIRFTLKTEDFAPNKRIQDMLFAAMLDGRPFDDSAVAQHLDNGLHLSAEASINITSTDKDGATGNTALATFALSDAGLGGTSVAATLVFDGPVIVDEDRFDPKLSDMTLEMEDRGLLDLAVALYGQKVLGSTDFNDAMASLTDLLNQQRDKEKTPAGRDLLDKISTLLHDGGKLALKIHPRQPLTQDNFDFRSLTPDEYTITYTAP